MLSKTIILVLCIVFSSLTALAQTIVPGGNVSGTWTAAGSPYLVQGSITIPADSTLNIEPGVEVIFQGLYPLTVNGLLEAVGTETDSIHFFPADINVSWWGIRFENAPDSSHLAYCTVSYAGTILFGSGAILCTNSNPVITHCQISNNYARTPSPTYAGGIALNNSNAEISYCNITNNYSDQYGGGINIYNSSPLITGCNISDNYVIHNGGGVFIYGNSNPVITNCTIERNWSNIYGGGISALGGVVNISECTIGYNHAETGGGGISIHGGSVFLDHCIIERNNCLLPSSNVYGGGIYTDGGTLTVDHCTFYWNEVEQSSLGGQELHTEGNAAMTVTNSIINSYWNFRTVVFNSSDTASVSYNDFKGESGIGPYFFYGNVPSGLGEITTINGNGDTCDVFYNTYLDPLFANPYSGDYHITWANWPIPDSTKSPCIDAGDPTSPHDPDNTITDMGAFYFHQPGNNIPGGYVSGIWTAAGSPYLIQGDITIHADSMLTIEPGVEVNFQGHFTFTVNGFLQAVGTVTDSIHFTASTDWGGITFNNAPDSSHIIYCSINNVTAGFFGALDCNNSNPVISHSKISGGSGAFGAIRIQNSSSPHISDCTISFFNGNGILWGSFASGTISRCTISYCTNSGIYRQSSGDLTLIDCIISNNTVSTAPGGGIRSTVSGSLILINCTISDNTASDNGGGGIWCEYGTAILTNCTINGNYAQDLGSAPNIGGGGICLYNANAIISYCTVFDNSAAPDGGGIAINNSGNLNVDHCNIDSNQTFGVQYGSGINVGSGCTAAITNSIISSNYVDYGIYNFGTLTVNYTDFYNNNPGPVAGNIPSGFGVINTINANGDSCDVYANIFLNPLFADAANGNFQITWANWPISDSTKSPCIDAGDPSSPFDPDSTVTDMGRYFFNQGIPVIAISDSLLDFGEVLIGQQNNLPLIIRNSGTGILHLQNIINQHSEFTHNWNPADSLILPNDSLTIMVTFTPTDTNLIVDTLLINNNDKPLQVELSGKGKIVVGIEDQSELPKVYALYPAYPNPFNPVTHIRFDLPKSGEVQLIVYDILGRRVATLVNKKMAAGRYEVEWNAADYGSGLYFYQLKTDKFNEVRKMLLVK